MYQVQNMTGDLLLVHGLIDEHLASSECERQIRQLEA